MIQSENNFFSKTLLLLLLLFFVYKDIALSNEKFSARPTCRNLRNRNHNKSLNQKKTAEITGKHNEDQRLEESNTHMTYFRQEN